MATPLIQLGVQTVMAQNVVFALPARNTVILATTAIQFSVDGSTFTADVTASTTGTPAAGAFVRCTNAAGSIVVAKAA
jgi:hypothetical protein